ncbi:MAG: S8 family serine peptidase [Candidatus Sericytochromatia bacterium]|nr:S8 family serine peptidase [Candidatus Sericytochromatia bacterium]
MRTMRWCLGLSLGLSGCAPLPLQQLSGAQFALGELDGANVPFQDEGGQTYTLQSLGATKLIVRFHPSVRGKRVPKGGTRVMNLPNGSELFRFASPAVAGRALAVLKSDPEVLLAEPDAPLRSFSAYSGALNDPLLGGQLYLKAEQANASAAWSVEAGDAASCSVAVLDSGIRSTHEDLAGALDLAPLGGALNYIATPTTDVTDNHGHGTQVAGIIAARAGNSMGIVGVAPLTKVVPFKVSDSVTIETSAVARALMAAADLPQVGVINLSLGGPTDVASLREAVDYAVRKGKVVIAAAGNSSSSAKTYPAAYKGVLAVGASQMAADGTLGKASFSNFGDWVKIAAPGSVIYTTGKDADDDYDQPSGTSMAAPIVSGAAALVRVRRPAWSAEQVRRQLVRTGRFGIPSFNSSELTHLDVVRALDVPNTAGTPIDMAPAFSGVVAKAGPNPLNEIIIGWDSTEAVDPMVKASGAMNVAATTTISTLRALIDNSGVSGSVSATGAISSKPQVLMTGLKAGTTYRFLLRGTDEAGQETLDQGVYTFSTKPVTMSTPNYTPAVYSPTLTWRTNVPMKRVLYYSESADMAASQSIVVDQVLDMSHSVVFPRLRPATRYYYRIVCTDRFGNVAQTNPIASAPSFLTSPIIVSQPTVSSNATGHHVSWSTNVPTRSQLWYGAQAGVSATGTCDPVATCSIATGSQELSTVHSIRVDRPAGLVADFLKPVATDDMATPTVAHGKVVQAKTSAIRAFNIAFSDIQATSAVLNFTTERLATVEIATSTLATPSSLTYSNLAGGTAGTHFRENLLGFAPATRYYVWLRLRAYREATASGDGGLVVQPVGNVLTKPVP